MGQPAEKLPDATYADIEALDEHMIAQLIDGELVAMPRPATPHARTCTRLSHKLEGPFGLGEGGPGGWVILYEPEVHFPNPRVKAGKDVLVPDLAGWHRAPSPELLEVAHVAIVPDWICEVISPSTEEMDREKKMPIYAREGVRWAWLVDPLARTLEAYVLEGRQWIESGRWRGDDQVKVKPFEAVEIKLEVIWGRE